MQQSSLKQYNADAKRREDLLGKNYDRLVRPSEADNLHLENTEHAKKFVSRGNAQTLQQPGNFKQSEQAFAAVLPAQLAEQ